MNKVNVVLVTSAPAIGKPEMLTGIRTRESAATWGARRGYATVYFWQQRERVYADKLTKAVDVLANEVETKSGRLLQLAENGGVVTEIAFWIAVVAIVILALGSCGKPW